ncbi:mammalian cell entry protein [Mycobacterium sp. NAZ190054]|nr:mammalian cell entry protein [Mycobacterium sp. NAZ190054]
MMLVGCQWQGVNSLPLPGATGRVPDATVYHVQFADIGSLESNSPVLINDVSVGSVGNMNVEDWHAEVEIFIKPGVVVPANAVATVGQTSLLGSSHVALNPPQGVAPAGRLAPGSTIPLANSSTYPSTEQTLAALSLVVNGGGLGQFGDIVKEFNAAFSGREVPIRDVLTRMDTFIGVFSDQRDDVVATIDQLNRLSAVFAGQRDTLDRALDTVPRALDVLVRERPRLTDALKKLGTFSDTATGVVADVKTDLVDNLRHLEPILRALADVGVDIGRALGAALTFPGNQYLYDHALKGDYLNLAGTLDMTVPMLKRSLLLGTRFEDPDIMPQAAVGDPGYDWQQGNAPPPQAPFQIPGAPTLVPPLTPDQQSTPVPEPVAPEPGSPGTGGG